MKRAKMLVIVGLVLALGLASEVAKADFTFGEPVNLETVIPVLDPAHDVISCFSYDGLEMYITSGSGHYNDLYVLKRASIDEDWGPPESLGLTVNSPNPNDDDSMPSISPDGLSLYFHSNRAGGYGRNDIYITTRATKNDPWGPPVNLGPEVNSSVSDPGAWITGDGLELYFHSWRPGGYGGSDMWMTRRATQTEPWAQALNVGFEVNSATSDYWPCVSPDGLVLFFTSDRPGPYGQFDLWLTRRPGLSHSWQAPANLGAKVNSPAGESTPRMSPDGSTLYFWTENPPGTYENWQTPILPVVDFNGDGIVNLKDFSRLAQYWGLNEPSVDIGPMAWGDGVVDIQDVAVLVEYWLSGF
jgi:hypothetical protein